MPVSDARDGGAAPRDAGPRDAGAPPQDAGPPPADAGAPPPDAGAPPPPPLTITTRTVVAAPDGSAATRTTVGLKEQVVVTASSSAAWSAVGGTVGPANGTSTTWIAPGAPNPACTITATPTTGAARSVTMAAIQPSHRTLANPPAARSYHAGKSGSGFVAGVTIQPRTVSFSGIEVHEQTVNAVATGYYKDVLGWDGIAHPPTVWVFPSAANTGLVDTVGTNPPGRDGPFGVGAFVWSIPQSYRDGAGGAETVYSTAGHYQVMQPGPTGTETTGKEGAFASRTP